MKTFCPYHSFDVSVQDAKRIQKELRDFVEICDTISNIDRIELVGGADVSFIDSIPYPPARFSDGNDNVNSNSSRSFLLGHEIRKTNTTALAAVVTYDVKHGCAVETVFMTAPVLIPYIPGFLSFREGPALLAALGELSVLPEVMIYDGCGIAHPRGLGLASHMAVLSGIPSVGCAKSKLCGTCSDPGTSKGEWTNISYKNTTVGTCLRTRDHVRPVFVSPGSGVSINSARKLVLSLAKKYRLPEPIRLAHSSVTSQKKRGLL